jgi:hypothetical protein
MKNDPHPLPPTPRTTLSEPSLLSLQNDERRVAEIAAEFRQRIAEGESIAYTVRWQADAATVAEELAKWHQAVRTVTSVEKDPLDGDLASLEQELRERILTWTPEQSTCLYSRRQGELKLQAMKEALSLLTSIRRHEATVQRTGAKD